MATNGLRICVQGDILYMNHPVDIAEQKKSFILLDCVIKVRFVRVWLHSSRLPDFASGSSAPLSNKFINRIPSDITFSPASRVAAAPIRNILDGHASHTNCLKLLETAENNDISLICLPSHCTHGLQPSDVNIYRPLKINFRKLVQYWQNNNANRKITRYEAGKLIGDAWWNQPYLFPLLMVSKKRESIHSIRLLYLNTIFKFLTMQQIGREKLSN